MFRITKSTTVPELIEIALQLDVGMFAHLPVALRSPDVAGLAAFRLLADTMHQQKSELSSEASQFLQKIDTVTTAAVESISKNPTAKIKGILVTELFEYANKFQRVEFDADAFRPINHAIAEEKLSTQAQIIFRPFDGRFFALIDPKYLSKVQDVCEVKKENMPRAFMQHAHFTLNDGMSKKDGEALYQKLAESWGLTEKPIFNCGNPEVKYLNKTVDFAISGAYKGVGFSNSRMANTMQLKVALTENDLGLFKKLGLETTFADYWLHVTFAENTRVAHPSLKNLKSLSETLGNSTPSSLLKSLVDKASTLQANTGNTADSKTNLFSSNPTAGSNTVVEAPKSTLTFTS